jgi:transcriptional regulator GlxA family with amidase domain
MGMEVMGLADLLLIANHVAARLMPHAPKPFQVELCSVAGGMVAMAGGWPIATRRPPRAVDWLVVPGFDMTQQRLHQAEAALAAEIALLRRFHQRGTALAAACVGAFLLAAAGVLDGRQATTSWLCRDRFRQQFPAVTLLDSETLVADVSSTGGPLLTSGSISAAHDLALYLIERHAGSEVASTTARIALIDGGVRRQAPYVDTDWLLPAGVGRALFADEVCAWMARHLATPFSLPALAAAFHVSPRTLLRRFKAEAGSSPLARLQVMRIEAAKKHLSSSAQGVDAVAAAVGYQDVASFIRLFKRLAGETPAAYRRRFSPRRGG